jgi:hypothetical protein
MHDTAWAAATSVIELFPLLTEAEQREKFSAIYKRLLAALEWYAMQCAQQQQRLHPSPN